MFLSRLMRRTYNSADSRGLTLGGFFALATDVAEIVGVAMLNYGRGPKIFAHTLCALTHLSHMFLIRLAQLNMQQVTLVRDHIPL